MASMTTRMMVSKESLFILFCSRQSFRGKKLTKLGCISVFPLEMQFMASFEAFLCDKMSRSISQILS